MPRAEAGTPKAISNQMKRKGLGRLRWYCQVCEKQCPDDNGFKQHTMSESHVRQMQLVGQNSGKFIAEYSRQFQRDFIQLLRTSHGEKGINLNRFYNEYIADKNHIHQNSTRWHSLTEFAKDMGRQGILRIEEEDPEGVARGGANAFTVAWIDNSPEALRRQDAIRKRERQDKGDEEREQNLIRKQIARARRDKGLDSDDEEVDEEVEKAKELQRTDGEKIKLAFGTKANNTPKPTEPSSTPDPASTTAPPPAPLDTTATNNPNPTAIPASHEPDLSVQPSTQTPTPTSSSTGTAPSFKPKNVFAATKKINPLAAKKSSTIGLQQKKPMSEAERIMKEELERKRIREERTSKGQGQGKRLKMG